MARIAGQLGTAGRPARAHPATVLLGALAAVAVAIGLYVIAPRILPVRIREGPMVQMATEDAVALVWFTSRPADCSVTVTTDEGERTLPATHEGFRNRVRINDLHSGRSYPYAIRCGNRALGFGRTFQTNRPRGERYSFLVLGDSGRGSRAQFLLAADMARVEPPTDFVLHTGDLVYPKGARRDYEERFFAPYRPLLARVNFWPCLGNHDVDPDTGAAAAYTDVFELPDNGPAGLPRGHNYWFDYASSRIAVIDSNLNEDAVREQVAPWLLTLMADPAPRWRFVLFHHPPYTAGKYQPDARVQRALVPALEAAGIDVVFNGHDHTYQRTHPLRGGQVTSAPPGVVYIITAVGGAEIYTLAAPRPDFVAAADDQHYSFTQATVDGDELTLRQIAMGDEVLDEFKLAKSAPPPAATQSANP